MVCLRVAAPRASAPFTTVRPYSAGMSGHPVARTPLITSCCALPWLLNSSGALGVVTQMHLAVRQEAGWLARAADPKPVPTTTTTRQAGCPAPRLVLAVYCRKSLSRRRFTERRALSASGSSAPSSDVGASAGGRRSHCPGDCPLASRLCRSCLAARMSWK